VRDQIAQGAFRRGTKIAKILSAETPQAHSLSLPKVTHQMSAPELLAIRNFPLPPAAHAPATRATILLVEDDRAIRRYLQVILERAGYEVVVTSDGLEAMKAALSSRFQAVVTDAIMPNLGGHELCRFLRRHPALKHLPVVLLSGSDSTPAASGDERPDVFLTKPVRPEELTTCVARLLEREF
jgi:CheY-like chemotaxis protein